MRNRRFRDAQGVLWGEAGEWAFDTFASLNAAYFADCVPLRGIAWGLTPHGGRLGHTHPSGRITLHPALLDPRSDAWGSAAVLGEAFARDVLLHEMIHGLLFARGVDSDKDSPHHNRREWCAEVERLALLLGLGQVRAGPVVPRRVGGTVTRRPADGFLGRDDIARFPHSLRPAGFYEADRGRLPVLI